MQQHRAFGALVGLALGDALGMPTQTYTADQIRARYGRITGLVDAVADQPVAPGMRAGSVTDDTEQALLIAELLCSAAEGGDGGHDTAGHAGTGIDPDRHVDPHTLAHALLAWEDNMRARGSLDLLGPSTKAALEAVRNGADPTTTGTSGATNGAAMRVTPVGIAHAVAPAANRQRFAAAVAATCRVTHNTHAGWESAAVVAAAVSLGIAAGPLRPAAAVTALRTGLRDALDLVAAMPPLGNPEHGGVLDHITRTLDAVRHLGDDAVETYLRERVGTSVAARESVAAAFAIADRFADRPFDGLLLAANLGDDTDTIGAIAGAILGAWIGPEAFPAESVQALFSANGYGADGATLRAVTERLLRVRYSGTGRVIHTGQIVIDRVLRVDHVPTPGADVFAEDRGSFVGGGFNAIVAARRWGVAVDYAGALGDGADSQRVQDELLRIGVRHTGPVLPGDLGMAITLTDRDAERTFISTRGAETRTPDDTFDGVPLRAGDVVYASGYAVASEHNTAALMQLLTRIAALPAAERPRVVFDVSPAVADLSDALLTRLCAVDAVWTVNEREARILAARLVAVPANASPASGAVVAIDAASAPERELADLAAHLSDRLGTVVLRAGAFGAWIGHARGSERVTSISVDPVDTNGAGDAHAGVLCAVLAEGGTLDEAVRAGNIAGALAVTRIGPATAPSRAEITARLQTLASPQSGGD